jgi:hypothetical protein
LIQVDDAEADGGFFDAVQPIYEKYGEGRHGEMPPARGHETPQVLSPLRADPRFAEVTVHSYDWDQTYTGDQYRKLMQSYSVTQMMEPTAREGLLDEMQQFVDEHHGGTITRPLVIAFVLARLAGQ